MAGPLCGDWRCPARVSCLHHLGRNDSYGGPAAPAPLTTRPPRPAGADSCQHYQFDEPAPWLLLGPYGHR